MTNEEANKIIYQQWQEFLENNLDYAGISDAYKMAIKALKQIDDIKKIILSDIYIQEDVMKYKMICEIIEKENK